MKTPLLLAALALFATSPFSVSTAQQFSMDGPAKAKAYVVYAAEPQTIRAGKPAVLELRFQVLQGYHVNSHTPKSDLLIPTAVTLQPANGVKPGTLEYPAGKPYSFSFDPGTKIDVYAGDFIVKLPVVATAGDHTLDGTLRYQACDNASCYPPRNVPVKIAFTAK